MTVPEARNKILEWKGANNPFDSWENFPHEALDTVLHFVDRMDSVASKMDRSHIKVDSRLVADQLYEMMLNPDYNPAM